MTLPAQQKRKALTETIWEALKPAIAHANTLYIMPDGLLYQVAFASLKDGDKYLCQKYDLHYSLSAETLQERNRRKITEQPPIKKIFLFGGADFGASPDETEENRGSLFGDLPGSKDEIFEIADAVSHQWETYVMTGEAANETNFKKLMYQQDEPSVLHIASHGFIVPFDLEIKAVAINNDGKSGFSDPMVRSGFALAGANRTWKDETPIEAQRYMKDKYPDKPENWESFILME